MNQYLKIIRKYLPQIAFGFAALWLFWQIYPIIFAAHDDLRNYTLMRRGIVFSDALRAAKTGRISHLWNHLLLTLPFLLNKVWFYKLVQFSALLFDIYAGWRLLKTHVSQQFADLTAVLTVSWACISAYHNLLIAYALCHQISVGFFLLSLYHFGNRLKKRDDRETRLSCFFLLLSVMIYEAFAAMTVIFLLWALMLPSKKPLTLSRWALNAAKRIKPQLLTVGGYCIVYFIWQLIFPPQYDGISFTLKEPLMSLYAVARFATASFPLAELTRLAKDHPISLIDFLSALKNPAAWLAAILAAAVFNRLLPRIKLELPKLRSLLVISGIGMFLPCVLIACSEKYIGWMRRGTNGYLPSFYSYLILIPFLLCGALLLYRTAPNSNHKKILRYLMNAAVFCTALSATAVNQMWKPYFMQQSLRYRNFDYAVSSFLPQCDGSEQLYAPDNAGIHLDRAFTEDYLKIYNPAPVAYIHAADDLDANRGTICLRMPENYAFSVYGETDSECRATVLTFRTLVPEAFNITLYDTEGEAVYYENVQNGSTLTLPAGKYFDMSVRVAVTA